MEKAGPGADQSTGLLASLRNLATTLLAVAQDRLELISTEIEEERVWLLHLLLGTFFALFFVALGVLMLTLFVVALFWDTHRILVIMLLAGLYLGVGLAFALVVRSRARRKPRLFSTSIAELAKDRQQLRDTDVSRPPD